MLAIGRRRWQILSFVWLACVFVVAAATVRDYGITWDEEYYKEYGVVLLNWYTSLGANQEALTKWGLFQYGGFFDLLAQLAVTISPFGVYETRHLVSLVFGLMGLLATYGIGYQVAGAKGGFFSVVFLTLMPNYYFYMFSNAKDTPFAALFALSLFCMLRSVKALPRVSRSLLLQLGVATGLAMGVRVAGIVLLAYVGLLWGGWLLVRWRIGAVAGRGALIRLLGTLGLRFSAAAALAWVTMVVFWPWAQVSPILHPLEILRQTANYDWPLTVFFEGRFIKASQLPFYYLPTWFSISLPEFYFVALLVGCILAARVPRRRALWIAHSDDLLRIGLLVVAVAVPIVTHMVLRSTIYDGLRQFLFVLPALAALAGTSIASFLTPRIHLVPRLAVVGAVLTSVAITIQDMAELHPYQYVYFNRLVAGGEESASTRFETDYYGASYREGVRWLAQHYGQHAAERIRVANPSMNFLTAYYLETNPELRKRFVPVRPWERPHIFMSITRWDFHKDKTGQLLHVVRRKGVPLLYVIEVTPPKSISDSVDMDGPLREALYSDLLGDDGHQSASGL